MTQRLDELQQTLRAIERGACLENFDNVLVRRVLQQPVAHQQQQQLHDVADAPAVSSQEAYKALVALRRNKKQTQQHKHSLQSQARDTGSTIDIQHQRNDVVADKRTATRPVEVAAAVHHDHTPTSTIHSDIATLYHTNIISKIDAYGSAALTGANAALQYAVQARSTELTHSQRLVERADAELQVLLAQTQALLPSQFLFERQLTALCHDRSLACIERALQRFVNRFYRLFFTHWCMATRALRQRAHERAAATIHRVYRGHCARRTARTMRLQLAAKDRHVAALLVMRIAYRDTLARRLQLAWRRHNRTIAIKLRQRRRTSALFLQRAFRRRCKRQRSLVQTLLHVRTIRAAVTIQRCVRGHCVRGALHRRIQQERRDARIAATIQRSVSRDALVQWTFARRGAAFVLCIKALYPFALRRRRQRLVDQTKRQRAAQTIARCVCRWFHIDARRDAAAAAQQHKWRATLMHEQQRTHAAATRIQSHVRRWVAQRQYIVATTRRCKRKRMQRVADKSAKLRNGPTSTGNNNSSNSRFAGGVTFKLTSLQLPRSSNNKATKATVDSIELRAVRCIQRCFRAHVVYNQRQRRRWRSDACRIEQRVLQRRVAATTIARYVRGYLARRAYRYLQAARRIRAFVLARHWERTLQRVDAAQRIARWLHNKRSQRIAQLWHSERARQQTMATRVQRIVRQNVIARRQRTTVLAAARQRDETHVYCTQSLVVCTQHVMDTVVVASLRQRFEPALRLYLPQAPPATASSPSKRTMQATVAPALCFPVLQLVFLVVAGVKDPAKWTLVDNSALLQTTLERSRVVALFKAINKHQQDAGKTQRSVAATLNGWTQAAPVAVTTKSPTKTKTAKAPPPLFAMTDVDVALAKAGGASKRALVFEEFMRVLQLLAELKFARVTLWWSRFSGSDAPLLALLWHAVFVLPDVAPVVQRLTEYVHHTLYKRCHRLQHWLQRRCDRKRGLLLQLEQRQRLDALAATRAATLVQTHVRSLLAKRAMRHRMQRVYDKYMDPDWGVPYWTNPRTGYSTWQKPRVLRAEDVAAEAVPFPPAHLALRLACDGAPACLQCAEYCCIDCDERFCSACFAVYHKENDKDKDKDKDKDEDNDEERSVSLAAAAVSGSPVAAVAPSSETATSQVLQWTRHAIERIALCGLCQFQVASRKCRSCFDAATKTQRLAAAPSSPSKQAVSTGSNCERESLFCDVCFAFTHRRGALMEHKSIELLEMCAACTVNDNDDDVDNDAKATTVALPILSSVSTQPQTLARAVQWQCRSSEHEHDARVCGACVSTQHPIELCGTPPVHVALQTRAMLERARRLAAERDARDRADADKIQQRAVAAKRTRAATKLQRCWRRRAPVLHAKRLAAQRRLAKQTHWEQLQADAKRAKEFGFVVRDAFGRAPPLATDSQTQRRLRAMNALERRQLEIRARLFGLLVHEYMGVGIPLPGVGRVGATGANVIETSEDLRGWVKNRQTLRLVRIEPAVDATTAPTNAEQARATRSAWSYLAKWDQTVDGGDNNSDGKQQSVLVDIDAKALITDRQLPLAQRLYVDRKNADAMIAGSSTSSRNTSEDDKDHVYVMYLVEYSMDPARVVWINHSLAERFGAWKRRRAFERKRQQQIAKDDAAAKKRAAAATAATAPSTETSPAIASSQELESVQAFDSLAAISNTQASATLLDASIAPVNDSYDGYYYDTAAGGTDTTAYTYNSTYYDKSTAYEDTSYDYNYGYGYSESTYNYEDSSYTGAVDAGTDDVYASSYSSAGYTDTSATSGTLTNPLVDSSGYFGASDGNASAWQQYNDESSAYAYESLDPNASGYGDYSDYAATSAALCSDTSAASWNTSTDTTAAIDNTTATTWFGDTYYDFTSGDAASAATTDASGYDNAYHTNNVDTTGNAGYNTDNYSYDDNATYTEAPSAVDSASSSSWEEVFDPTTEQVYYVNRATGESAWSLPAADS